LSASGHYWQPPLAESSRSRAAAWVERQARRHGLPMAHFEYRETLPLPAAWLPEARADLGRVQGWSNGQLPESKYQSYRHDLWVGSYHPSHRAKWTAHEWMHGIQGFAWAPGASPFFHALAGWQAEILPVALWYFFDEADLRRCPLHQGQGPLFGAYCPDCERAAGDLVEFDASWWERGQDFVRSQLEGVRLSIESGRLHPRRYATLDLASDGLAYAASHQPRLNSRAFHLLMERFPPTTSTLDAFSQRIEALTQDLLEGRDVESVLDASTCVAQDLAWRLLMIWTEAEGDVAQSLLDVVDQLASGAPVEEAISVYEALYDEWVLPQPSRVFACGYPLTVDYGLSRLQIRDGLESCVPQTLAQGGAHWVDRFVSGDQLERLHLARRFAASLERAGQADLAGLARLEAALADPPKADLEAKSLVPVSLDGSWRLGTGHELVRAPVDLLVALDGRGLVAQASSVLVVRDAADEVQVFSLDEVSADWLEDMNQTPPSDEVFAGLLELGVLVPDRHHL